MRILDLRIEEAISAFSARIETNIIDHCFNATLDTVKTVVLSKTIHYLQEVSPKKKKKKADYILTTRMYWQNGKKKVYERKKKKKKG